MQQLLRWWLLKHFSYAENIILLQLTFCHITKNRERKELMIWRSKIRVEFLKCQHGRILSVDGARWRGFMVGKRERDQKWRERVDEASEGQKKKPVISSKGPTIWITWVSLNYAFTPFNFSTWHPLYHCRSRCQSLPKPQNLPKP